MPHRWLPLKATSFQKALTAVSLDILQAGIGGRLTPSIQIQEKLEVGSGTVQKALQELSENGGVVLRVKGHQGTLVIDYNPAILWRSAQLAPLRISLTPPGAQELGALSMNIRNQFRKFGHASSLAASQSPHEVQVVSLAHGFISPKHWPPVGSHHGSSLDFIHHCGPSLVLARLTAPRPCLHAHCGCQPGIAAMGLVDDARTKAKG